MPILGLFLNFEAFIHSFSTTQFSTCAFSVYVCRKGLNGGCAVVGCSLCVLISVVRGPCPLRCTVLLRRCSGGGVASVWYVLCIGRSVVIFVSYCTSGWVAV